MILEIFSYYDGPLGFVAIADEIVVDGAGDALRFLRWLNLRHVLKYGEHRGWLIERVWP